MPQSAFVDKSHEPAGSEVAEVLGAVSSLWDDLVAHIAQTYAPGTQAWKHYSTSSGWSLVVKQKARTVAYLLPQVGCFTVSLAYGQRAVEAAHQAGLPQPVLDGIDAARVYVEGRPVRVEVRSLEDAELAQRLIAIKMAN